MALQSQSASGKEIHARPRENAWTAALSQQSSGRKRLPANERERDAYHYFQTIDCGHRALNLDRKKRYVLPQLLYSDECQ